MIYFVQYPRSFPYLPLCKGENNAMKKSSRLLPLALALLLTASAAAPLGSLGVLAADGDGSDTNVALHQDITATSNYVAPEGFFDVTFLVDGDWDTYPGRNGNVKLGWNNNTPVEMFKETDPIDVTISLDSVYRIDRIVIKPMQWANGDNYPRGYELQASKDGRTWTTLVTETNKSAHAKSNTAVQPIEYKIAATDMQYFRFHITKNSTVRDANGSFISSLGEIELYGVDVGAAKEAYVNKYALNMNPGETDRLCMTTGRKEVTDGVAFKSSNESVVKVDTDGTVHALAVGQADVQVKDAGSGKTYTVPVTVEEFDVHDKFQIVAFIPYFYEENINPTTFDNLKKGGITNCELNFALDAGAITYENNLRAIRYCAERGLEITVSEQSFNGGSWPGKTDEQILEFVRRYSHLPGVEAYYITDEPAVATQFARPIALVKSVDPYAVTHMNFCGAYDGIVTPLQNALVKDYGLSLDYIMYDAYVFRSPVCSETTLYTQLDYNRAIGQRLGVPTATYIQSMAWNNCNRPNADAIRYQVFASLAAGVKQISYFCWQTPRSNAAETYGPAIIDINGNPTDLFEPVSRINAAVQALGPTLMKLETRAVYHTGASFGAGYNLLPAGFFITPCDWEQDLCLSYMVEEESERAYSMLVNRDYNKPATVRFTADAAVKDMYRVSPEDGRPTKLTADAEGRYTLELLPGEGALLTTNADFSFALKETTNFHFLGKAIEAAESVDLSAYREEGKEAFLSALESAKQVLADADAKQPTVDKALKKLRETQTALAPVAASGLNFALHKPVKASNSYEEGTYFSASFLTDGVHTDLTVNPHQGWSVDPYSALGMEDPVTLTLDLGAVYDVHTVMLRPCIYNGGGMTPSDFEIRLSVDNKEFTTVRKVAGLLLDQPDDQVYSFTATEGRYVQIYITRHGPTVDAGTGGALSQIGEIEVFGTEPGQGTQEETTAETMPETELVTQPQTEVVTEAQTSPDEQGTAADTDADTSIPTSTESGTEAGEKNGCSSSLLPLTLAATLLTAAAALLLRRRRA